MLEYSVMTTEHSQPENNFNAIEKAFRAPAVLEAVSHSDWFTPSYIEEVHAVVLQPEKKLFGAFTDPLLSTFFELAADELEVADSELSSSVEFVSSYLVGRQGHVVPVEQFALVNDEVMSLLAQLGLPSNYQVDRSMVGEVGSYLMCILALPTIRDQVVRVVCSWGSEEKRREVLVWSQLVRIAAKQYGTGSQGA